MSMSTRGTSRERWEEAQKWEREFWDTWVLNAWSLKRLNFLKTLIKIIIRDGPGDDSNYWWAKQFGNYNFVPLKLSNAIEFGCGPFTNLRIALEGRTVDHVIASDPLSKHYVGYKRFQLSEKWKRREYLIDDHSLEETPFATGYFDLVICINVLDHVQDPIRCLEQLTRVVAPGGLIIFGQDLTNEEDLKATHEIRVAANDCGHPHCFDNPSELLSYFNNFKPIISRVLSRKEGRLPLWHFGTLIFAGEKC